MSKFTYFYSYIREKETHQKLIRLTSKLMFHGKHVFSEVKIENTQLLSVCVQLFSNQFLKFENQVYNKEVN